MGRTNKLVDGCYSYWVGALFPLVASLQRQQAVQPHGHQSATTTNSAADSDADSDADSLPDSLPDSLADRSHAGQASSAAPADDRDETEQARLTLMKYQSLATTVQPVWLHLRLSFCSDGIVICA